MRWRWTASASDRDSRGPTDSFFAAQTFLVFVPAQPRVAPPHCPRNKLPTVSSNRAFKYICEEEESCIEATLGA